MSEEGYKPNDEEIQPEEVGSIESEYAKERLREFKSRIEDRLVTSREFYPANVEELQRILDQLPEIEEWAREYASSHPEELPFVLGLNRGDKHYYTLWSKFVSRFNIDEKKVYDNVQEAARLAEAVNAFGGMKTEIDFAS